MNHSRHIAPQINAGSMADIAFLLLIFFLVVTTISVDKGINRRLPDVCTSGNCLEDIHERNILRISINSVDAILVENEMVQIKDLKSIAKDFLDNNGNDTCDYCHGLKNPKSSDNPSDAVISLQNDKQSSYEMYIAVQDILTQAYYELREVYAKNKLRKSAKELTDADLKVIREAYPFKISEAELK